MGELAFVSTVLATSGVFVVSAFVVGIVVGVVVTKRRWRR
jgi:flagellar biosynthesis protein FliQ